MAQRQLRLRAVALVAWLSAQAGTVNLPAGEPRETVLDRKVHIEERVILEIPKVPPLCDQLPGLSAQRIDLGDVELYCEQEGAGTPLVLLHGGPGATHHGFHPSFSNAKTFARVIYYDQRGCGKSLYRSAAGYSVDQAADDLHRLRIALKIDRWIVLGCSYGGALAQCYAVKYPEDVAGLVLVGSGMAAPVALLPSRQDDFTSPEERRKIREIHADATLTVEQKIYNSFLSGDWKRQSYYRPSREAIARTALYEWKHDRQFNAVMSSDVRRCDLRGAFDACPLPTLILEGDWDLTWNADKPDKLHRMLPRAKLERFEHSGHSPFDDEPERFFGVLRDFVRDLPRVSDADVLLWKKNLAAWKTEKERSPEYLLRTCGYDRRSNEKITQSYTAQWLSQLKEPGLLLKTGFALYDLKRYEDASAVFRKMSDAAGNDRLTEAIALLWQGQMLDLLERRAEAVAIYRKVAGLGVNGRVSHDQFGMSYSPSAYAAERIEKPFTRKENLLGETGQQGK